MFSTAEGIVLPSDDPDFDFEFFDRQTILGGTGRFEEASGHYTFNSKVDNDFTLEDGTVVSRTFHRITGYLTRVEAGRQRGSEEGEIVRSDGIVLDTFSDLATSAPDEPSPLIPGFTNYHAASRSTVPVLSFATMDEVGTSTLVRTGSGVSFRVSTTGLEPGTVHTLWVVIFNQSENCTDPGCGNDDLFNPAATPDLAYGAGTVIGGSGRATFAGHRNEGDNSGSIMQEWLGLPEPGLVDARAAEIHFVVHSHGPKIPGLVDEMLHTFNAGCGSNFIDGLPPVPESLGTYGPNTCEDVQFAVHAP